MSRVRPFQFTNLKSYSRERVALEESFARYLSFSPLESGFEDRLSQLLERYLKVPCRLATAQQKAIDEREVQALLPEVGCFLLVGAAPTEHKILVDLDASLAATAIDRLLGGNGAVGRVQRPFTDIEEGVLSFLVLHTLAALQGAWSSGRELALSLDGFVGRRGDLQPYFETAQNYEMLGFRLAVGDQTGYARVLLPGALVGENLMRNVPQSGGTPDERRRMRRVLASLDAIPVMARIEAAQLDLTPADLAALEPGDIVILEQHQLRRSQDSLEGYATVRLGAGRNGALRCRLFGEGNRLKAEVVEIVVQEHPLEATMDEEAGEGGGAPIDNDNFEETEGLLRDVAAPVVVELGRLRMSTAQVVRLHSGQILRLPRGPNDPVDLVVNGKLLGRGELIEVEGELGVRILQLVGERG